MRRMCMGCNHERHMSDVEEISTVYYRSERFKVVDRYHICSSCNHKQRDRAWESKLLDELSYRYMERVGYSPADLAEVLHYVPIDEAVRRIGANEVDLLHYLRHEKVPLDKEIEAILEIKKEIETDLKMAQKCTSMV